jgi:hypothetical protein
MCASCSAFVGYPGTAPPTTSFTCVFLVQILVLFSLFAKGQEVHAEEGGRDRQLGPPHVDWESGVLARFSGFQGKGGLREHDKENAVDGEVHLREGGLVHTDSPRR